MKAKTKAKNSAAIPTEPKRTVTTAAHAADFNSSNPNAPASVSKADLDDFGPEGPAKAPTASQELATERAENEEVEGLQAEQIMEQAADSITRAFMEHFELKTAPYFPNFTRGDFPRDAEGRAVKVARLYMFEKTVVDIVPADAADFAITRRKVNLEALGYRYTWIKKDELRAGIDSKVVFDKRMKPVTDKKLLEIHKAQSIVDGGGRKVLVS